MELFGTILCVTMLIVQVVCLVLALRAYDKKAYYYGYEQGKKDAVRHGKWEHRVTEVIGHTLYTTRCSICNEAPLHEYGEADWFESNYCPNCGAKMGGD